MHVFPNLILSPRGKKPAIYTNNGTGRDTYVSFNNGGNFPPETRLLLTKDSGAQFTTGMNSYTKNTDILPQRIRYFSDGTGRDSYIIRNGVIDKIIHPTQFNTILREYPQSPSKLFMKLPPIERQKKSERYRTQKELTQRLSYPNPKFSSKELISPERIATEPERFQ